MNGTPADILLHLQSLRLAALDPANLDQWALIVLALLAGFVVERVAHRTPVAAAAVRLPDLVFPLVGLCALVLGWRLQFHHAPAPLLHLAMPLLLALVVIRFGVRIMRTLLEARGHARGDWERTLARVVWCVFALHVLGVLDPVMELLDDVALPIGDHRVSVLHILQGSLVVVAAIVLSLWGGRILERRVMQVAGLDVSLRVILTKLIHGGLLTLAVLFTLPLVGIDTTFLSVIGGALGVGLGFGLQKIASNYVSGFIILLERSVRLDDVVTVDGRKGRVSHMEARYTVLKGADGLETIIPNETFVTAIVINHTLNDRSGAVSFSLWLHHDADLRLALAALQAMLLAHDDIANEPAPTVQVAQVSDVGIEISLTWWVPDLAHNDANLRPALMAEAVHVLQAHHLALARRYAEPVPAGAARPVPAAPPTPAEGAGHVSG